MAGYPPGSATGHMYLLANKMIMIMITDSHNSNSNEYNPRSISNFVFDEILWLPAMFSLIF